MIHAPAQRRLALKGIELESPMIGMAATRDILGLDVDTILQEIEDRKLAWAWDIGLGSTRREIRILSKCVRGYQASNGSCGLAEKSEEEITGWILAQDRHPWIEGVRFKFLLSCENSLINALVDCGELMVMPGSKRQSGPRGSDKIVRASAIQFLKQRRIK